MLQLYNVPVSSYGCKIRILLAHKKIEHTIVMPPDGYGSEAYRKIIPAGTVPAIDDDGFRLADSEAIAEYFNEKVPEPAMLPSDILLRAQAREISRFHDTRLEPLLRAYFAHVSPATRNADFIEENAALLQQRLDQLSHMVTPRPLLFGTMLTIADCSFVASFAILRLLHDILGFNLHVPEKLTIYEAALASHGSVCDAREAYIAALDQWSATKLST